MSYKALFNVSYTTPHPPTNLSGERRAAYIAERKFYNLTSDYNYLTYTLSGEKAAKNKDAESYFTRTGTGLFGLDGEYDEAQIKALKKRLANTESIIWHGFVSFDKETSLNFTSTEQAEKFMRQTFGGFLQRAGFKKDNVELYASLHKDKSHHHHIHFAFFEKEGKSVDKNGIVGFRKKGKISQTAIDNYLVSANMYVDEHAEEYYTARDKSLDRLKVVRSQVLSGTRANNTLNIAIDKLLTVLPQSGRLTYKSDNMKTVRPLIDEVVKRMILSDKKAANLNRDVLMNFARISQKTRELIKDKKLATVSVEEGRNQLGERAKIESVTPLSLSNVDYFERLHNDYKARLGNIVLGMCKELRKKQYVRIGKGVNDHALKRRSSALGLFRKKVILNTIKALGKEENVRVDYSLSVQEIEAQVQRQNSYLGGNYA